MTDQSVKSWQVGGNGLPRRFRRPMPENFAETFIEHGHDRIMEEIHHASWQMIAYWIGLLPDDVLAARDEYLNERWPNGRPGPRRRRYVMGQTLASKRRVK